MAQAGVKQYASEMPQMPQAKSRKDGRVVDLTIKTEQTLLYWRLGVGRSAHYILAAKPAAYLPIVPYRLQSTSL